MPEAVTTQVVSSSLDYENGKIEKGIFEKYAFENR